MNDVTLQQAQEIVDKWIKEIGKGYFGPLTQLGQLVEEVGEVARLVIRTYGEQSFKESDKDRDLGEEIADVLFVLICLANSTGVNLSEVFTQTMLKKTKRDTLRHQENEKITRSEQ